jgi:hypothetical protein
LRSQNTDTNGEERKGAHHFRQRIQKATLTDRLGEFAQNARDEAEKLEPGPERQALLEKVRKAEAASEIEARENSSGLEARIEKGAVTCALFDRIRPRPMSGDYSGSGM